MIAASSGPATPACWVGGDDIHQASASMPKQRLGFIPDWPFGLRETHRRRVSAVRGGPVTARKARSSTAACAELLEVFEHTWRMADEASADAAEISLTADPPAGG